MQSVQYFISSHWAFVCLVSLGSLLTAFAGAFTLLGLFAEVDGVVVRVHALAFALLLLGAQHLARHEQEHVLDVDVVLGTRLEQLHAHLLGEAQRVLGQHHFAIGSIVLVAHKHLVHLLAILLNLVQPALHVCERLATRHVVHHDYAVRAPVIRAGDGAEAFLSRRVPDLQLHPLAVHRHSPDLKVHADRRDVASRERIVCEPQQ